MLNTYSLTIEAPPDRVFYWLNEPERLKQWLPGLIENEQLDVTPEVVGSTFRQVYLENGRRMEMHGRVTAFEENRRLVCEITGKAFDLHVDYTLEDLGGRTRLTQVSEVRFKNAVMKFIGGLMQPLLRKSAAKRSKGSFDKLKWLAEGGQAEGAN